MHQRKSDMNLVHEREPLLSVLSVQNIEFIVTKSLLRGLGWENSNLFISVLANTIDEGGGESPKYFPSSTR